MQRPGPVTRAGRRPRRMITALVAITATALALAACGGSSDSDGSDDTGGSANEAAAPACPTELSGTTELTLWHPYNTLTKATLEAIAADYNASQTKVHVSVESQGNTVELQKKFAESMSTPDQLPDVVFTEDTNLQFMSDSGVVVPASSCQEADSSGGAYLDSLLAPVDAAYTVRDTLWPSAFGVSTLMMYENDAQLRAAGLEPGRFPATLDELRTMAEKVKAANLPGVTAPVVMKLDPWILETLLTGSKQPIVNEDNGRTALATESELDDDAATESLEWIQGMIDDGLLATVPFGDNIDDFLAFSQGSSTFIFSGQRSITTVAAIMDGQDGGVDIGGVPSAEALQKLDIDAGLFPGLDEAGQSGVSGSAGYIVNTGDAQVAAAWDFMKYFNALPQQQRWVLEGSYLPASGDVLDSPEVQSAFTSTRAGRWTATVATAMADLDSDFPGPLIGPFNEYRDALSDLLTQVAQGADVDSSLSTTSAQVTDLLQSYKSEVTG